MTSLFLTNIAEVSAGFFLAINILVSSAPSDLNFENSNVCLVIMFSSSSDDAVKYSSGPSMVKVE